MAATGAELAAIPNPAPQVDLAYVPPQTQAKSKVAKLKANMARKVQLMEIGSYHRLVSKKRADDHRDTYKFDVHGKRVKGEMYGKTSERFFERFTQSPANGKYFNHKQYPQRFEGDNDPQDPAGKFVFWDSKHGGKSHGWDEKGANSVWGRTKSMNDMWTRAPTALPTGSPTPPTIAPSRNPGTASPTTSSPTLDITVTEKTTVPEDLHDAAASDGLRRMACTHIACVHARMKAEAARRSKLAVAQTARRSQLAELAKPVNLKRFFPAVSTPVDTSARTAQTPQISRPVDLSRYGISHHSSELSKPVVISDYTHSSTVDTPEIATPVDLHRYGASPHDTPQRHYHKYDTKPAKRSKVTYDIFSPAFKHTAFSSRHTKGTMPYDHGAVTDDKDAFAKKAFAKKGCTIENADFEKHGKGSLDGWDTTGVVEFERDRNLDGDDSDYYAELKGKGAILAQSLAEMTNTRFTLTFKASTRQGIHRGTFAVYYNGEKLMDSSEPPVARFKTYTVSYSRRTVRPDPTIEFRSADPPPGTGGDGSEATVHISEVRISKCGPL